jgi:hypothetical protein
VRSLVPALALAAASALASEPPRPSALTLDRAFETSRATLVEVKGPRRQGPGVVVGARGQVLTALAFAGGDGLQVRVGEQWVEAKTVQEDSGLKFAVVALGSAGPWPSAAVGLDAPLSRGAWLVGLTRSKSGEVKPRLGQVTHGKKAGSPLISVDLPLGPGCPLFDPRGRLVALCIEGRNDGCSAVPLSELKLLPPEPAP